MSDLDNLITRIEKGIHKKSNWIDSIRDPHLLLKSLKQLQQFIGNKKVKESIALQVNYLILNKHRKRIDPSFPCDEVMLNCILSGQPGVGKSQLGTILAKIWHGLGMITNKTKSSPTMFQNLADSLKPEGSEVEPQQFINIFFIILFIWVLALVFNFYQSYGSLLTVALVVSLLVVAITIFYYTQVPVEKPKQINKETNKEKKEIEKVSDSDYVTIVSRVNFIGGYVGSTAIKTTKLLEENLGKVLFVDEAYSLLNNPEDPFGLEALNTLNLFMSQHPNDIIIIFAGYQNLIDKLFDVQPGLRRRFMWQFECQEYSANDLFDIFKLKLDQKRWKLSDIGETKRLFNKYSEAFPNAGGDVERLVFFSNLSHANSFLQSDAHVDLSTLTPYHVEQGLLRLMENNKSSMNSAKTETTENPYEQFANLFKHNYKKPQKRQYDSEPVVEDLSMEETESIKNVFKSMVQRQF